MGVDYSSGDTLLVLLVGLSVGRYSGITSPAVEPFLSEETEAFSRWVSLRG